MLKKLRELNFGLSKPKIKGPPPADLEIRHKYVILGGGTAAGYACATFVKEGLIQGNLAVISKEPVAPYERPALTKSYIHPPHSSSRVRLPHFYTCAGEGGEIQTELWYQDNGISLYLNCAAIQVIAEERKVICQDLVAGNNIIVFYDKLIVATGSRPLFTDVFPPDAILKNIYVFRNEQDGHGIVKALEKKRGGHILIVGGGYLGLECAAAFSGWEYGVTVILPENRVLSRLFTPEISYWYEDYFKKIKNIRFVKNMEVQSFTGSAKSPNTVKYAVLTDGRTLEVDFVIIAIGAVLNTEILEDQVAMAPPEVKGIEVDEFLQTSDPNIYTIGDIAAFPFNGKLARFEHVDNARKMAKTAVENVIYGNTKKYDYMPYIYSRLFEYTRYPIIFRFYGTRGDLDLVSIVHFGDYTTVNEEPQIFGALYVDRSHEIIGGIMVNGSPQNFAELRQIISENRVLKDITMEEATRLFQTVVLPTPLSRPKDNSKDEERLKTLPPEKSFFLAAAKAYQNLKSFKKESDSEKMRQNAVETGGQTDYEGNTKIEVYEVGPASYAVVEPGRCIMNDQWSPYELIKKMQISDNSYVFSFRIPPNPFMEEQRLNLATCACILALPSGGNAVLDDDYNYVDYEPPICPIDNKPYQPRPYTPVSTNAMVGKFELLIKIYPDGKFTQHLNSLVPGESFVMFKHVSPNVKIQYPFGKPRIGLIVGGTGVNPIIQMLHAILGNIEDNTRISMLYGNRTSLDILGKQILDTWANEYSQLSLSYILSREPADSDWDGLRGHINEDVVLKTPSFPTPQEDCTIFVCGPDGMYESVCGARAKGGFCTEENFDGWLKKLGYKPSQVYKF